MATKKVLLPHEGGVRPYGWKPSKPDFRDKVFSVARKKALPPSVDLRTSGFMPPVVDQGELGSCTANAAAGALGFDLAKQGLKVVPCSRLFIYYEERVIEKTVNTDSGAELRDAAKVLNKFGACDEALMPYVISKFKVAPTATQIGDAAIRKVSSYAAVPQTANDMKTCLAAGYPILIGFTVYESFESAAVAATGKVPMPKKTESVLGGHAVLVVGYDDTKKVWIVRNSWGEQWGGPMKGYCTMPYAYLLNPNLASDFWTLRAIGTAGK